MISIHDLALSFDSKEVLHIPSYTFETGKTHGIIGMNGAGKTTFFNVISTFLKPQQGIIKDNNGPVKRADIAYLETHNFFYSNITGREYLAIFPASNSSFNLDKMNELFGLPLDEIIETYSTGMKKKIALLAILKQDKPVYILDEPFNGLDLETNRLLEITLEQLKSKNKTIFISSHILSPLTSTCDAIHLLQGGAFQRMFLKDEFDAIDAALFGNYDEKAREIVAGSV